MTHFMDHIALARNASDMGKLRERIAELEVKLEAKGRET